MKTPFRQTKAGGCCFYVLANLLNNEAYLQFVEEAGHCFWHMNEALMKIDPHLRIEATVQLGPKMAQQNRITDKSIFHFYCLPGKEEEFQREVKECVRLWCATINGPKFQHILGVVQILDSEEELIIVDSLNDNLIYTTQDEFLQDYWVLGFAEFYKAETKHTVENGGVPVVLFYKSMLGHLIEHKEGVIPYNNCVL